MSPWTGESHTTQPDTVYVNGLLWPGAGPGGSATRPATALAVVGGHISALGDEREIRGLAGPRTEVVDLGRRRLIPGLIDGHIHAVRAGASWDRELHWTGVPNLWMALEQLRAVLPASEPGEWIRAVGGWHPSQFGEGRAPTRHELDEVSGDHPIYLQALYESAVLNSAALRRSGIDALAGDPPGGTIERDGAGRPTGRISGLGAFSLCLGAMPPPTPEDERRSTAAMLRDLHATGLTGLQDAGGFGMAPERYDALFDLWRREQLTMRLRLFLSAVDPGREFEQIEAWLRHARSRFGDEMLRFVGIGEVVHFGCHDFEGLEPFTVPDDARAELLRISLETARRGWPMQIHAVLDATIDMVLDCWEAVNAEVPVAPLRFSIAHADRISPRNIQRLRKLGIGVVLDDHLAFKASSCAAVWGPPAVRSAPPIGSLVAGGVPVAAGTDANRSSSWNPWLSLWWLVAGRSLDGRRQRAPEHCLTREAALTAYTTGSAWLSFEEGSRGRLQPGARADFAVLDQDYFTVPEDDIPTISSDLTVVGGRVVWSNGTLAA
jgi:predicted amidohydrolase YtcJ